MGASSSLLSEVAGLPLSPVYLYKQSKNDCFLTRRQPQSHSFSPWTPCPSFSDFTSWTWASYWLCPASHRRQVLSWCCLCRVRSQVGFPLALFVKVTGVELTVSWTHTSLVGLGAVGHISCFLFFDGGIWWFSTNPGAHSYSCYLSVEPEWLAAASAQEGLALKSWLSLCRRRCPVTVLCFLF